MAGRGGVSASGGIGMEGLRRAGRERGGDYEVGGRGTWIYRSLFDMHIMSFLSFALRVKRAFGNAWGGVALHLGKSTWNSMSRI